MLEHLIKTNQFFAFSTSGGLVSIQDLLTKKLGKRISFEEAVEYMKTEQKNLKKRQFINKIIEKARKI